jgi:hypothetical protein
MFNPKSHRAVDMAEQSHASGSRQMESQVDLMRVQQGWLSKIQFSVISGEDPQLWRTICENYFDMYGVESPLWV